MNGMLQFCSWPVFEPRDELWNLLALAKGQSNCVQRFAHAQFGHVLAWQPYGIIIDHMAAENAVFPWFSHIFSMFFIISMVFPWFFHGFPMVFPWFSHGYGFQGHRDAEVSIPERSIALWHHWRSIFGGNALCFSRKHGYIYIWVNSNNLTVLPHWNHG